MVMLLVLLQGLVKEWTSEVIGCSGGREGGREGRSWHEDPYGGECVEWFRDVMGTKVMRSESWARQLRSQAGESPFSGRGGT